jgi:hypothetical protein
MSWEKAIADKLTGVFKKAESIESKLDSEVKTAFDKTRQDALAANDEVNKLKADLQTALIKAAGLHQAAVDAANAARAAAEADVAKYKALADAHAADLATQASQINPVAAPPEIIPPTPPADVPPPPPPQ